MTKRVRTKQGNRGKRVKKIISSPQPMTNNNASKKQIEGLVQKIEKIKGMLSTHGSSLPFGGRDTNFFSGLQGLGFDGDRDLYESVGWNAELTPAAYLSYYKRGIGKTVVNIKPDYTWNGRLRIRVKDKESSTLPDAWEKLDRKFGITNIFNKADKLAGILQYSVIMMGFNDPKAKTPNEAVPSIVEENGSTKNLDLLFLKVFRQDNAQITQIEGNINSPRFGLPKTYQIKTLETSNPSITPVNSLVVSDSSNPSVAGNTKTVNISASRCVHIAENLLEGDIYGTPRMEASMNYIQDLDKITGGSGEMYWRGALPGWFFSIDADAEYQQADIDNMDDQIDAMLLGLERYVKAQGVTPIPLAPQISDPRPFVKVQYEGISVTTRTPMRILLGSESGEMASTQDADAWDSEIESRRHLDCERWVRDLIDRLMSFGVLPREEEYEIIWPAINAQNKEQQSKIALNISLAIKNYTTSINPERVISPEDFLSKVLPFEEDEARQIQKRASDLGVDSSNFEKEDTNALESANNKLKLLEKPNAAQLNA